jgi:hypothetical protein
MKKETTAKFWVVNRPAVVTPKKALRKTPQHRFVAA